MALSVFFCENSEFQVLSFLLNLSLNLNLVKISYILFFYLDRIGGPLQFLGRIFFQFFQDNLNGFFQLGIVSVGRIAILVDPGGQR